jgi:hypothetical protein
VSTKILKCSCGGTLHWQKRDHSKTRFWSDIRTGKPMRTLGPIVHAYVCDTCGKADR